MNNMRNKILMTLALLLTAVTGAWAQDTYTITFSANGKNKTYTDVVLPAEYKCEYGSPGEFDIIIQELYGQDGGHCIENASPTVTGTNAITPGLVGPNNYAMITITAPFTGKATVSGTYSGWSNKSGNSNINYSIEVYFGTPADPNAIDVKWDAATKTGTFVMPAFDVEIAPIYAPVAQWAKVENVDQLPTAIEGIYAGQDAAIVKAGTVAKIGETENPQGTVMYFATTDAEMTAEKAAKANGWLATVPTAAGYDGAQTVYVWYYIQGQDTPDGQQATEENTFNDSEISATPLTVQVLTNKFDIQFNAANDNTIEAGKATVTVGGTAATVTDGKLQGVKMGSEVKVTAKEGYKFRSVEVKKTEAVSYTLISEATTSDYGKVVCAAGHLHDAKTAVPRRCTAVGILGKVTTTGHGLILALSDATSQTWNTINGWTSVTTYASTTLKQLPDDTARGSNLTSYSTLGSTTVSNWCVAQKSDYEAIFTNLGSTTGDSDGMTYDGNVNAYITTGVGGTAITDVYWSATFRQGNICWSFDYISWGNYNKTDSLRVRPVLAF